MRMGEVRVFLSVARHKFAPVWALAAILAVGVWAAPNSPMSAIDPRMAQIIKSVNETRIHEIDTKLVSFGSRSAIAETLSTPTRGPVPARKWIYDQFQAISQANGGRLQVSLDTFDVPKRARIPADQTMTNVVAVLPGTDRNDHRIFLVGGHYDSIPADFADDAPGANDNASGVIVSLECARALARYRFPATIEFFAYDGEEEGLIGSAHAAQAAKAAGLDIAGVLNDDIVGGDQTPGNDNTDRIRAYGEGLSPLLPPAEMAQLLRDGLENDSPARELVRYVQMVQEKYLPNFHVVMEYREDRFRRDSDQHSWLNAGFPYAMTFREWNENGNHQHQVVRVENGVDYGDLEKWVSMPYLANVARVNAIVLASLASSPQIPELVTFHAGQQIGNTISWTPVPGAAGYVLLYRQTADSEWSERPIEGTPVAPPAEADFGAPPPPPMLSSDIRESGDSYIFGVAAVDAQGHESLPRIATAGAAGGRGRGGRRGGGPGGPGRSGSGTPGGGQ